MKLVHSLILAQCVAALGCAAEPQDSAGESTVNTTDVNPVQPSEESPARTTDDSTEDATLPGTSNDTTFSPEQPAPTNVPSVSDDTSSVPPSNTSLPTDNPEAPVDPNPTAAVPTPAMPTVTTPSTDADSAAVEESDGSSPDIADASSAPVVADDPLTPEEIESLLAEPKQEFRFHHVHFNAADPDASVAFYERHFDATELELGQGVRAVRSGAHWLVFDQADAPPAPWELTSSVFHVGFGVDEVQSAHDALVAAGVESETEPFSTSQRLCTGGGGSPNVAFLYGPDREVFEINPANSPDFRHVHFLNRDPVSAGQWYVEHMGFRSSTPNPSSEITYCQDVQISPIFGGSLDGITVYWYPVEFGHGYYPDAWEGRDDFEPQRGRALDHLAFSVEDLDRAVRRLQAEGVTVVQPPQPWLGAQRSAFVAGPDGVQLEVVEGHLD